LLDTLPSFSSGRLLFFVLDHKVGNLEVIVLVRSSSRNQERSGPSVVRELCQHGHSVCDEER
jgi:hypothetical protein